MKDWEWVSNRVRELRIEDPNGRISTSELERQAELEDMRRRVQSVNTVEELKDILDDFLEWARP